MDRIKTDGHTFPLSDRKSKERCRNYSQEERNLLAELAEDFPVVNARRNDEKTIAAKKEAWQEIHTRFHSSIMGTDESRTIESLKKQLDNMKTQAKRYHQEGGRRSALSNAKSTSHERTGHALEWIERIIAQNEATWALDESRQVSEGEAGEHDHSATNQISEIATVTNASDHVEGVAPGEVRLANSATTTPRVRSIRRVRSSIVAKRPRVTTSTCDCLNQRWKADEEYMRKKNDLKLELLQLQVDLLKRLVNQNSAA